MSSSSSSSNSSSSWRRSRRWWRRIERRWLRGRVGENAVGCYIEALIRVAILRNTARSFEEDED